jgi:hypothetical protein
MSDDQVSETLKFVLDLKSDEAMLSAFFQRKGIKKQRQPRNPSGILHPTPQPPDPFTVYPWKEVRTAIRTKKRAKELGYLELDSWVRKRRYPVDNANYITVKGSRFFSQDETVELISRTEIGKRDLVLPEETKPIATFRASVGNGAKTIYYDAYRVTDCSPIPIHRKLAKLSRKLRVSCSINSR